MKEGVLKSSMNPLVCNSDIFLEIINVLSALGRYTEAQEILSETQPLCQSESEEFFILSICSQLAVQKGDLGRAGERTSLALYFIFATDHHSFNSYEVFNNFMLGR